MFPTLDIGLGVSEAEAVEDWSGSPELSERAGLGSLAERLQQSLSKHSLLPAIEGRNTACTYEELDRQSAALASVLGRAGVRPGDIVPLLMRRSPAMIVAQVALIRMGAAYAPIDLTSPAARQLAMLQQIAPSVLVADGSAATPAMAGCCTVYAHEAGADGLPGDADDWVAQPGHALAYVMFTSGTTGTPKGVLIPQSGITRLASTPDFANVQIGSRWAVLSSPAFDASTLETWAPLLNGGCCVVQENPQPSIDDLADFLRASSITDAWLTSALFNAMVDDRLDSLGGLSQLLTGGERVSPHHALKALEAYPNLRLINGYGPTENTTFTLCHSITVADTANPAGLPLGRPIRGTTVRIGGEAKEPAQGELYAGGLGVALGYLNDPELTLRKFVHIDGRRWYRTGDLVRRTRHGVFEFIGRADRQVKLQGHRVELDEVERALGQCPGVTTAVVRLRGSTAESRHLVGYYSCQGAESPSAEFVTSFLRLELSAHAVPSALHELESIPINSSGKVDLMALDLMDAGRATEIYGAAPGSESETEIKLIRIWGHLFTTLSIHKGANFHSLGGNSLMALQLSSQVRRQFGRDLSPLDVLRTPVLRDQALLIEAAAAFDHEPARAAGTNPLLPLTAVQRAMLAATLLDDSQSAFLVQVALRFRDQPGTRALRSAFEALAQRHPSLRLQVLATDDPAHGRIGGELPEGWWTEHGRLEHMPSSQGWSPELLQQINRPLNLARDGVMRVDYWTAADDSALLVWTVHHVAVDEASVDRCLAELDALLNGGTLPPVYGSPLAFAAFEKALIDRVALQEWPVTLVAGLQGLHPPLPRAPARGAEFAVPVSVDLSSALLAACDKWGITPFTPLLVAFGAALQEVFGPHFRYVSTPFSRRAEAELVEPVGCLLDLRILDAGLRDGELPAAALRRVNETVQRLQFPSFFPQAQVAEAVNKRDPLVARHINMFGFTWRLNPVRTLKLGEFGAELMRVPQLGARFGITLHCWLQNDTLHCSIEAVEIAVADGRAQAVGNAFVRYINEFAQADWAPRVHEPAITPPAALLLPADNGTEVKLRQAWSNSLNVPIADIGAGSHFLQHGGNSLTAMRLVAGLRREHGLSIDAGAFLSRPTFEALCALAVSPLSQTPSCSVILGAVNAPQLIVVFPGNLGPVLGPYRLADELMLRLGENYAVAIVDLETMLLRAPHDQLVPFLGQRIEQLMSELGWNRIVAVAGLSSGGMLALNLVAGSPQRAAGIPVWLIDTYAPLGLMERAAQRFVRPVLRQLLRYRPFAGLFGTHVRTTRNIEGPPPTTMALLRRTAHEQLYAAWKWPRVGEVHLVQALKTVRQVALLRRSASNGFKPARFRTMTLHRLSGSHGELTRELAPATASFIADSVKARANR